MKNFMIGFSIVVLASLVAVGSTFAAESSYPGKAISYIVQAKAGGSSDAFVRKLMSIAEKHNIFPVSVAVLCKPGSSGATAYGFVKNKADNPYVIANTTQVFVATSLRTKTYQVPDDFTPIARIVTEPTAVVVKGDSPYNSIGDLIKAAKANPGQIKWAGGNVGSKNQVLVEMTQKAGNCKFTYIPFDGDNQARAAVMGEHVTAATNQVRDVVSLVKAGELKILAVAGEKRIGLAPDVPTFREAGYDVVLVQSRGVVAPAGIPEAAKKYLGEKFKLIIETPEFKKYASDSGMVRAYLPPDEWKEALKEEMDFWTIVYKDLGML